MTAFRERHCQAFGVKEGGAGSGAHDRGGALSGLLYISPLWPAAAYGN